VVQWHTGTYWSTYNGTDDNGDGIGDTSYNFYENYTDSYPLMAPVDIAVIPEFPIWLIMTLFLVATLVVVVARRKLFRPT
jgi:hypothetical protein